MSIDLQSTQEKVNNNYESIFVDKTAPSPAEILPRHQQVATSLKTSQASSWEELTAYTIGNPVSRDWISWNSPREDLLRYLIVDIDHDDDTIPGGMPLPMCTIHDRETWRHHHVWMLARPVTTGPNAKPAPQAFYRVVQRALTHELGGDEAFTGTLAKNAWSPRWATIWHGGQPVGLKEFLPWLPEERTPVWRKGRRHEDALDPKAVEVGERNTSLFHAVRFWAYDHICRDGAEIAAKAADFNARLATPLPEKEVENTAKSITKFMVEQYTGQGRKVGPMVAHFHPDMTTRDRRRAAAHRTNKNQAARTAMEVRASFCLVHLMERKWPTISHVSQWRGWSRNTIKKHLKNLDLPI